MKRLLLIVDMEGVAGIERLGQLTAGTAEYESARTLLTAEANAVIEGAAEAGFGEVVVSDSHAGGAAAANILEGELDRRATLAVGDDPYGASLFSGVDAVACIGMHAAANTRGFIAHTVSVHCDWFAGGRRLSEADIVMALAAEAGVPVFLLSGDDVLCRDIDASIATVVTKHSLSPLQCRSVSPEAARERLRTGAAAAVPCHPAAAPCVPLQIRFKSLWQADAAERAGATRVSDYGVEVASGDFREGYSRAMRLAGATFGPVMAAVRGRPGSEEMISDLSELITRAVPSVDDERRVQTNGDVARTLDAFMRLTEAAGEFSRALRALVLHIAEGWAPGVFARLRMKAPLDRALADLAAIPVRFSPEVHPADGMSRLDAWYILRRRGMPCTAPPPGELSAYLKHLQETGYSVHAWLLGEMAAALGVDVRSSFPERPFRGVSRLWDLYWVTHEFFLATDYMRRPAEVRTWCSRIEELFMAVPWLTANGHADLAAEVSLCLQMAGETAAPRHRELMDFLRSSQAPDGVLSDGSMGDPPETMSDHATGLLFLVYAGIEERNRDRGGNGGAAVDHD